MLAIFVSALVALGQTVDGLNLADPVIGPVITLVILHITWESWQTISKTEPGEMRDSA